MNEIGSKVSASLASLEKWIEEHDYKGFEPFDGLSSPLSKFSLGNLFMKRVFQQMVRRCPVNLRPMLFIRPLESTKGRGYITQGYMINYHRTGIDSYRKRSEAMLEWLDVNKSPNYKQHSWANHFDVAFRGGFDPAHEPIIVWTSIIGQAYLDAYELFEAEKYLKVAESVKQFIMEELPREEASGGICISYIHANQRSIHNANMLGAAFLGRYGALARDTEAKDLAKRAMTYSCNCQMPNGSWWYGEVEKYHWIDNFHTGYNLDSLKTYIEATGDEEFKSHLLKGIEYYRNNFFINGEIPKYYHDQTYPIDIQCAAQSVETLVNLADLDSECGHLARKCGEWSIDNMQNRQKGYFFFRVYRHVKDRTPMIHWGQGTMYKALSSLLTYLERTENT